MSTKGPLMISVDVTYQCNFRCLHCFNGSGENCLGKELTDEEILKVADMVAELQPTVICFCGGEPLLRADIICEAGRRIIKKTNNNTVVNTVTNGWLMTKELAEKMKNAGFTTIQVSLDGMDSKTHDWLRNKEGSFEHAKQAITYIKKAGLKAGVAFTPHANNIHQIDEVINLCKNLKVDDFRVQPLMPLGRAQQNLKDFMPSYMDYKNIAIKIRRLKYANIGGQMTFDWGDPVDHVLRFSGDNTTINPLIGVNAYGEIYISPYIPITFGNVRINSLKNYWENGLIRAWKLPIVKELSDNITDINKLDINQHNEKIPRVYYENNISIDILREDKEKLEQLTFDALTKR